MVRINPSPLFFVSSTISSCAVFSEPLNMVNSNTSRSLVEEASDRTTESPHNDSEHIGEQNRPVHDHICNSSEPLNMVNSNTSRSLVEEANDRTTESPHNDSEHIGKQNLPVHDHICNSNVQHNHDGIIINIHSLNRSQS